MRGDVNEPMHVMLATEPLPVTLGSDTVNVELAPGTLTVTPEVLPIVTGTITTQNLVPAGTATANSAVEFTIGECDTLCIQITGTYTGALSIQATVNGTTWVTLSGASLVLNAATSASAATIASTSQGLFQVAVGSFVKVRVTALAAVTGTATISLRGVQGYAMLSLDTALPAGSATLGAVTISGTPATTATPATGTTYNAVTTASTNAAVVKASAGTLYNLTISNPTATASYIKLYNKTTAPTVGTDVPVATIPCPANSIINLEFGAIGKRFATGIGIAATDVAATVAAIQINGTYI